MTSPFHTVRKLLTPAHLALLNDYLHGREIAPITVEMDLVDRCNCLCPHCAGGRGNGELTTDEATEYLKQMSHFGVSAVTITGGGEPTLHTGLAAILASGHTVGLDLGLISNGVAMTEKDAEAAVLYCQWCRISIDADGPEMYEQTHGLGPIGFSHARATVRMLAAKKREHKADCTIGVGFLTSAATAKGMIQATKNALEDGADYIQFRPFHHDATPVEEMIARCRRMETSTFRVLASTQKYEVASEPRTYRECHGAYFCGVIQADATMTLCCHTRGNPHFALGSLRKEGFASVWNGERRKKLLAELDVQDCQPLCRLDAINRFIAEVENPKTHENFL